MSTEITWVKAEDLHNFISGIFAAGEDEWPVPRSVLNGLRLKQALDGIKIYMTLVYLEYVDGRRSIEEYESLKRHWSFLLVSLSTVFTRNEEWAKVEHLEPKERSILLRQKALDWVITPEQMNEEELELHNEEESLLSFLGYLEKMAKHSRDPFQHVLGHLSRGTIYYDDLIPIRH